MEKALLSKNYYTGFRILFLGLFLFTGLLASAQVTVSGVDLDASSANDLTTDDLTVMACWDADRLDLGRVGIRVDPKRLFTTTAQDILAGRI